MFVKTCRTLPVVILICLLSFAQQKPAATLIIANAKIWTVDAKIPQAEAIAVLGDRIVAVGSIADAGAWRGPDTKVIDAGGKLVLPGFNDAHVHFVDGSAQLTSVQLKDAKTPEEFARRIAEHARKLEKGEWILQGNWDDQGFTSPQLPTRQMIDAASPQNPVFVNRYDGHMCLANSLALKLAGVTAKTPDPPGGTIVRDAKGEPTGVLKDAAMNMVYKVIPPLTPVQRMHVIREGMAHAASLGVTSVQDMNSGYAEMATYAELAEKGALTLRIYAAPRLMDWNDQAKLGIRRAFGSPFLRMGGLKAYADGSLGSSTAYFYEPFTDDPGNHGLLSDEMHPISRMRDRMMKADAAGLQLCIHAIGDKAIATILDLFTEVIKANGTKDRRLRIEHAQHMAPKDFARFAELGVIASVEPYHAIDDGRFTEKRIGPERSKTTYAFKSFLDHKVRLALGTDWFVAPLNPMETIYAAVTRATLDGKRPGGWFPEQKLTVSEAVEAYTTGSAYAEFQDKEKGSITPGKLADLVILSDDIFTIKPEAIRDTKVILTIVGGEVVFAKQ